MKDDNPFVVEEELKEEASELEKTPVKKKKSLNNELEDEESDSA
eukprot:CAMPEP_0205813054 /NCGR_PEP_ID=MMETSP0205-20121125/17685_1 /ASSEMBLY_ACC=CAM_ASM_000278 /TAXON_ID=36767 /ORGANISM="Euplotes focardii, Strain TN1" /LENGTH=43 /DNA_ID= /DNA_START= /DNA_END= /DNA_ORIENTATION=